MCDFCKYTLPEKLEGGKKRVISKCFYWRFSFSRHCNQYLLWSLTNCVLPERHQPGNRTHCGIYTPSGCMICCWEQTIYFKDWKLQNQWRGTEHSNYIANQKKQKSNGALSVCLPLVTMTDLPPKCIDCSICLPAVSTSGQMFRNDLDST